LLTATTNPGYSYQWIKNTVPLIADTLSVCNVKDAGAYSVVITDIHQCKSASHDTIVTLYPSPVVYMTSSGALAFCEKDSIIFSVNDSAGYTYQWKENNTDIPSANLNKLIVKTTGIYSVVSTTLFGCSQQSADTMVTVFSLPATPTIMRSGSQLISSASLGNQWYFNGVPIDTAVSQSITPHQNGDYQVRVTNSNGCHSDSSAIFSWLYSGIIPSNGVLTGIYIYPNPANRSFYIRFESKLADVKVILYNMVGDQLLEQEFTSSPQELEIDISKFVPALYTLKIISGKDIVIRKVIKE
jgi:hypothetical protein